MGTRGAYGFIKSKVKEDENYGYDLEKTQMKITYNHYDSYFGGLGMEVMKFIATTSDKELNDIFDRIVMVREDDIPTREQIDECKEYTDLSVGEQDTNDWYCLLRNAQGNLEEYKKGLRYMIDNKEFMGDSLFCEYAYIINLDENCLEIYKGFNKNKDTDNLYTQYRDKESDYVEVELFDRIGFDTIREFAKLGGVNFGK